MRYPTLGLHIVWCFVASFIPLPGARASAAPIPHGTVELIAEQRWVTPGRETTVGLNFQLEKGWHIYWVNPGDSGEPPSVQWHLPDGLTAGEIKWPAPRRLGTSTIVDFGYEHAVMLLLPVRASSALPTNQAARLDGQIRVLVCREICVSGKAHLSLALPVKSMLPEPDPRTSELFGSARKSLPSKAPRDWEFKVSDQRDSFVLTGKIGDQPTSATFFPLEESQVDNSAPQKFVPVATGFQLTLRKSDQMVKPIKQLRGVLELPSGQSYSIEVNVGDNGG